MNDLKTKKSRYFILSMEILLGIIITNMLYSFLLMFNTKTFSNPHMSSLKYFAIVISGSLVALLVISIFDTYFNYPKYYDETLIPTKDFEIRVYNNLYIFALDGRAWIIKRPEHDEVLQLKEIKVTTYYNKKLEILKVSPDLPFSLVA